ncbi:MAG: transporter substrate-binding domain-containing protein [Desulfobacterales bacterium]|nr:MAG: transporter substrate-binding domain-containing protein [Desulfobacterales bacterium]
MSGGLNFINEKNEVVGFDAEIGREIGRRLGVEPVIVTTAWDGILAGLLANKYDTICGSMTITAKRQEVVDFVGPYYRSGRGIFIRQEDTAKTMADLQGKTIGVTLGETHEKWARTQPGWKIQTYKGLPELLLELENKRIDAIVIDSIPGLLAIKQTGKPIKKMELPEIEGGDVNVGIAIRKNNPQLQAAMQKALDEMMADGTYTKISNEWIGYDIR